MRTDHKIGIAVVLFVIGAIVIYNVFSTEEPQQQPRRSAVTVGEGPDSASIFGEDSGFYAGRNSRNERVLVGLGAPLVGRGDPENFSGTDALAAEPLQSHSAGATQAEPATPSANTLVTAVAQAPPAASTDRQAATPQTAATDGWPDGSRTYVVRAGDSGFWTVAENAYGHGKYWHLVAKANPKADSNVLRAGQKLTIPPLPQPTRSSRNNALVGRVVKEDSGASYYYVRDGDSGFWTVSENAYGNGKHWALIAKANPNVSSQTLRPGQKLIIPPLAKRQSRPAPAVAAVAAGGASLKPGEKWYVVEAGDRGFWDVAKKNYGSGTHWATIAKANPQANPNRLRVGQKLRIPAAPAATPSPSRRTTGTRVSGGGEPFFD